MTEPWVSPSAHRPQIRARRVVTSYGRTWSDGNREMNPLLHVITYPARLALHFWCSANPPTYDTNARAREVLLGGITDERKSA